MTEIRLFDSHLHLSDQVFEEDRSEVLQRARDAGVSELVTVASDPADARRAIDLAGASPGVWATVGLHPHEAAAFSDELLAELDELAARPEVVAIGETGLDYHYEHSPPDAQQRSFRAHIAAARETGLPLIVHTREADADTARILEEEYARGPFQGLLHCFTAGPELAQTALDLGFYISLSGVVTFKNAEALRQTVKALPLERLLVETDSPYLAPVPKRGKRNEPAYVVHTVAYLAEFLDIGADEIARATTANFFRLFGKADAARAGAS